MPYPKTIDATGLYISEEGLSPTKARSVRDNNAALDSVRETENTLCILLAETRWLALKLTREEYVEATGIHQNAIGNSEDPEKSPERNTYTSIYRYWKSQGISADVRNSLLDLLTDKRHVCDPDENAVDPEGERMGIRIANLYYRWSIMLGTGAFEKISVISKGGLWQREKIGQVPDAHEIRTVAKGVSASLDADDGFAPTSRQSHLPVLLEEAMTAWRQDREQQLRARGIAEPMRQFAIHLEAHLGEFSYCQKHLVDNLECTDEQATSLACFEPVPFAVIAKIAGKIIPEDQRAVFEHAWKEWEHNEADRETFGKAFERARDAQGVINRMLSIAMEIRGPKRTKQKEPYRPSAEIRRTCDFNSFSSKAPAGILSELVGNPERLIGREKVPEPQHLRSLFLERLRERGRKQGSAVRGSELRIARALWGMDIRDVAAIAGCTSKHILDVERGREDPQREEELLAIVETAGRKRAEGARLRLREIFLDPQPTTVADVVSKAARKRGGFVPLARDFHERDTTGRKELFLSEQALKRIAEGNHIPPLPMALALLRHGLPDAVGTKDSPALAAVTKQWYETYPEELAREDQRFPWTHPIARFFGVLFMEDCVTRSEFCEQKMGGLAPSTITRDFQAVHGGDVPSWERLTPYLDGAGIKPGSPRWTYIELLHRRGGNLEKAIGEWKKYMSNTDQEIAQHAQMLGLSAEERQQYFPKLWPKT